jgi:hypothetical protein
MDLIIEKARSNDFVIKRISTKLYKDKLHDKTLLCHVLYCPNNYKREETTKTHSLQLWKVMYGSCCAPIKSDALCATTT